MDTKLHKDLKFKDKEELKRKAVDRAIEFVAQKYEATDELMKHLQDTELWFTNRRRAWYCPTRRKIKVGLSKRRWITYNRKTIGMTSNGTTLPKLLHITLILILEFTHAVQDFQGRKYSEVETVRNEIEYVKLISPSTLQFMSQVA